MPISYKDIKTKRVWKASTGLTELQFHNLSKLFASSFEQLFDETLSDKANNGTNELTFKTYKDLLFFGLYSLKSGLTYDLLGLNFGLSSSNAFANQSLVLAVLEHSLQVADLMPKREFRTEKEFKEYLSKDSKILIDVTEQRIQRSVNQDIQKSDYSGKKKPIPPRR